MDSIFLNEKSKPKHKPELVYSKGDSISSSRGIHQSFQHNIFTEPKETLKKPIFKYKEQKYVR